jgi:broad specificity phosphatase PhoE
VLGLPVTRDARLRERCLGVLEGTAAASISPAVTGLSDGRVADPDARPAGGESLRDFYRGSPGSPRADDARADRRRGPGRDPGWAGDVAVVAHGGTLRMLSAYRRGIPVEQMTWGPLANACVVRSPDFRAGHPVTFRPTQENADKENR